MGAAPRHVDIGSLIIADATSATLQYDAFGRAPASRRDTTLRDPGMIVVGAPAGGSG